MTKADAFKGIMDPKTRTGRINRMIIQIVDGEPRLSKAEVARRTEKRIKNDPDIDNKGKNSIRKTHIDKLEGFVFDKDKVGSSHLLSISNEGHKLCRRAGVDLPQSTREMLIEILENKLKRTLNPRERKELQEGLTEDAREALQKISKKHPSEESDRKKIKRLIGDSIEKGHPNPIPILKGAWIFDAQRGKRLLPYLAKVAALLRTEGGGMIDALTIAERRGCKENLEKLSDILNGLTNSSADLMEIREIVQKHYMDSPEKTKPSPQSSLYVPCGEREREAKQEADTSQSSRGKESTVNQRKGKDMGKMTPEERERYMDGLGIPRELAEDK